MLYTNRPRALINFNYRNTTSIRPSVIQGATIVFSASFPNFGSLRFNVQTRFIALRVPETNGNNRQPIVATFRTQEESIFILKPTDTRVLGERFATRRRAYTVYK